MRRIQFFVPLLLALSLLLVGCAKDYLNTQPIDSQLDEEVYTTADGMFAALNGIHNGLLQFPTGEQSFGRGLASMNLQLDMLSDENINTVAAYHMSAYRWQDHTNENGGLPYFWWRGMYNRISVANMILANLEQLEKTTPDKVKAAIEGQAYAIRGYCYFQLTQLFGQRYVKGAANQGLGVPLRTEFTLDVVPRSTVEECYAQVNSDLDKAIDLIDSEGTVATGDKGWISYPVVRGIKARVMLAQGEWEEAAKHAVEAIENPGGAALADASELLSGFNSVSSREWMWAYHRPANMNPGYEGFFSVYGANHATGKVDGLKYAINRSLYDKMGENDVRRQWWICEDLGHKKPADGNLGYFDPGQWEKTGTAVKFRCVDPQSSLGDNVIMRLGEMYYIAAEAYARAGNEAEARNYLSKVMVTRDPDYDASGFSGDALIAEIMRNKRIDLYWEGVNFLDMKRLGRVPDRLGSGNAKYLSESETKTFRTRNTDLNAQMVAKDPYSTTWQFKIPYTEIRASHGLVVQNP